MSILAIPKIEPFANLRDANLRDANLRGANLRGADLHGADLHDADLRDADLRGANLRGADLHGADLHGANLRDADLHGADLHGANLRDALDIPSHVVAITSILPDGDIIGYKKLVHGIIAKLLIPKEAKRSNATGRKCRAEHAIVLEGEGESLYDKDFHYKVGETVRPTVPFDNDRWTECSSGIHFYITKQEAEDN
jgi:hypothetical protein